MLESNSSQESKKDSQMGQNSPETPPPPALASLPQYGDLEEPPQRVRPGVARGKFDMPEACEGLDEKIEQLFSSPPTKKSPRNRSRADE